MTNTPLIGKGPTGPSDVGFASRTAATLHQQQSYVAEQQRKRRMSQIFTPLPEFQVPPSAPMPNEINSNLSKSSAGTFYRPKPRSLESNTQGGRPKVMASYYSAKGSKYTGRALDGHSLALHQEMYYAYANICKLNAEQGL